MAGERDYKKLPPNRREKMLKFRNHDPMPILGVPDVVVREAVRVHVEAIRVPVHVRDEDLCNTSSISPPTKP